VKKVRLTPLLVLAALAACNEVDYPDLGAPDLAREDHPITASDRDGDGLDDAEELRLASEYLPFLSVAPDDQCPTSGLVVRVTPGELAGQVRLRYGWLFDRVCGAVSLEGDGGSFSIVVDPARAGAAGIIALRGVGRQDTACQRLSTCGRCGGQLSCAELGDRPAVWAGRDRHTTYANRPQSCTQTGACMVACVDAQQSSAPPIVNVGEPNAPLIRDLTVEGFIRPELGWQSPSLLHYDPWGGQAFGSSPSVVERLTATLIDPSSCAQF